MLKRNTHKIHSFLDINFLATGYVFNHSMPNLVVVYWSGFMCTRLFLINKVIFAFFSYFDFFKDFRWSTIIKSWKLKFVLKTYWVQRFLRCYGLFHFITPLYTVSQNHFFSIFKNKAWWCCTLSWRESRTGHRWCWAWPSTGAHCWVGRQSAAPVTGQSVCRCTLPASAGPSSTTPSMHTRYYLIPNSSYPDRFQRKSLSNIGLGANLFIPLGFRRLT